MSMSVESEAALILNCAVRSVGLRALDDLEGIHEIPRQEKVTFIFNSINKTNPADRDQFKKIVSEARMAYLLGLLQQERVNAG